MAEFREDEDVYPLMIDLVACLCAEIEAAGLPRPCRCSLMPGDLPVLDFGSESGGCGDGCGQAWVRLVAAFPADTFPNQAIESVDCSTGLAYQLEVGISRCEPAGRTVGGRFIPPTAEEQLDSVRLYTADMAAMRRAIKCCFPSDAIDGEVDVAMGSWRPLSSAGGVGGGTWEVFVRRI